MYTLPLRGFCLRQLLMLAVILIPAKVFAQSMLLQQQVQIKGHYISVTRNANGWLQHAKEKNSERSHIQALVHFTRLPSAHDRSELKDAGITIGDFIGGKTFTAIVELKVQQALPEMVYGISNIDAEWKIADGLTAFLNRKSDINVLVSCYGVATADETKQLIMALGGKISATDLESLHIYKALLPANTLKELAGYYDVAFVSPYYEPVPLNFESRTASKANIASLATAFGGYGLDGKGVTVGVGDNVSGNFHIDLKDRIINYNPQPYTDHGVHINGIVGGAGIIDPKGEGVAPGATLVDHLFDGIWQRTGTFFPQYNMTITNNSYAEVIRNCFYAGTYDNQSVAVDKIALQYPEVLHVFASGNDGDMTCDTFPNSYATVSGGYQPAKNNLVVTSTDKNYKIGVPTGSCGPVKDGRLKPEITAIGVDVNSTTHTEEYLVAGGTSMACPGVAGDLALLTQRYKQLNSNANPRADVLKAVVLNGATDIGNPGPDYKFGFGFMNVARSLQILDNKRYTTSNIANGDQQTFTVNVPPNTAQLKVLLCYFDAATSPMAATVLVNDLDLNVTEPSSTVHRPLILNPSPAHVQDNAVEGDDRRNNTEQVVINNPVVGTYTISVNGFNVPSGSQNYVVSYDFVPVGVTLTYPTTGAAVKSADSLRIYWDASDNNNSFSLEYSTDGGGIWNLIDNNIPSNQRAYRWAVPQNLNSGKCKMRITRNNTGQQYITGLFVINTQPIVTLDAVQCPGYIRINWAGIPGASAYEVMMKRGPKMEVVATAPTATYTFAGLALDSTYYMAVRPVIDGLSGYRSIAVKRMPNDGSCAGNISDGDMMVQQIVKPATGRKFTSTELKSNETLSLLVRNLDDVKVDSFNIFYRRNNGAWQQQTVKTAIAANSTATVNIPGQNLNVTGVYKYDVAVKNLSLPDLTAINDSITKTVRQLNNQPVNLSATQLYDFENWDVVEATHDSMGISPDERWDYQNESDTARLRSFVDPRILVSGNRSISLDAVYNAGTTHGNEFTGTFNLSNYNIANDEVRVEFDYILHGKPQRTEDNYVAARGQDTRSWQPLYVFKSSAGGTGQVVNSGSLSLTDVMLSDNQPFSPSTQIDFLQKDKSLISERNFGSGITLDNVKIYTVQNDMQLLSILSPATIECGLSGQVPLVINLRNGVNQTLTDVQLYYQLDGGTVINETLASITGKQTVAYTFNAKMDMSNKGGHVLNVWVSATGDTYLKNDSILNYNFHNQPLISGFPYLETFEQGDGNWYAEGLNSSWAYGTPASHDINKAASGTKAWKTNLSGNYNPLELSYLYSPCIDVSKLSFPKYRCKIAYDIEDCGVVLCDAGRMEYSTDGKIWQRLNDSTNSSTWYTDTMYNIWTGTNTAWHSVSVKLPKGLQTVRFRYPFSSDAGTEKEGLAVDDVEIFDDIPVPAVNDLISISPNPTTNGNIDIQWSAKGGASFDLVMYNAVGKEVYRYSTISNEGYNKATITTPHFSSGVYMMRIIIGDKRISHKIVYL